jgi:hypothetical protein
MRLDGTGVTKILQGLIGVLDVAVDADAGHIYFTGPGVFRANLDGSNLEMLTPVHYAGLAWDPVSQSLFLTADNEGHIDRLDLRTGTITLIHQFPVEPLSSWLPDIAVDVINRKIYWIHSSLARPALQRSDLDGSNLQDVVTVDPEPIGGIIGRYLTIDPSGRYVYWSAPYSPLTPEGGPGGIFRVNLDGSNTTQVLNLGSNDAQGLDLGPGATTSFKCPLDQGFWRNHTGAWPVTSLTLGRQTYTQGELLALFDTPPRGDASVILAHQLIAAKLNIANGSNSAPISSTIADADNLLSQFPGKLPYNVRTFSAIGQQMVNKANVLDRYNNGDLTPDCQP